MGVHIDEPGTDHRARNVDYPRGLDLGRRYPMLGIPFRYIDWPVMAELASDR